MMPLPRHEDPILSSLYPKESDRVNQSLLIRMTRATLLLSPRYSRIIATLAFLAPISSSSFAFRSTSLFQSQRASSSSSSSLSMSKKVLVPIADGSEEIETTCITDTLTRFGADVTVASVMPGDSLVCTMSRGIKILADMSIEDAASQDDWDLVALPGGMPGAQHLRDSAPLMGLLQQQHDAKKLYGAVCAAPAVVLSDLLKSTSSSATCYPAPPFRSVLENPSDDAVVVQGNVVTSQGPGTSLLFALALGEELYGKEKADEIAAAMLVER